MILPWHPLVGDAGREILRAQKTVGSLSQLCSDRSVRGGGISAGACRRSIRSDHVHRAPAQMAARPRSHQHGRDELAPESGIRLPRRHPGPETQRSGIGATHDVASCRVLPGSGPGSRAMTCADVQEGEAPKGWRVVGAVYRARRREKHSNVYGSGR